MYIEYTFFYMIETGFFSELFYCNTQKYTCDLYVKNNPDWSKKDPERREK